jgi:WD40 repeat protein
MRALSNWRVWFCIFVVPMTTAASPAFAQIQKLVPKAHSAPEALRKLLPKMHYAPGVSYDQTHCLVFSPDGGKLLVCNNHGGLTVLQPPLGQVLAWFFVKKFLEGFVFSPDGEVVAGYCSSRDDVFLLDTKEWKPSGVLPTPDLGVVSIAFSPDGKYFAAVCEEAVLVGDHDSSPAHTLLLWDFATRKVIRKMHWDSDSGRPRIQFSPDSKILVTTQDSETLLAFWDVKSGRKIRTIASTEGYGISRMVFLPGGAMLASVGMDDAYDVIIKVWSVANGELLQTLRDQSMKKHVGELIALPGEKLITASTADGTIRLWDIRSARQIAQLDTGANIDCLTLSPNGETLVCNLRTTDLRIWKLTDVFPVLGSPRNDPRGSQSQNGAALLPGSPH